MKFLDEAKIYIRSGDGGSGCSSFRREKFVEFGGPDGGNGGKGGNIEVIAFDNLNTLIDYRYQQHFKAKKGHHGMGRNRTGADGQTLTLKVPVGTQVLAEDKETILADFTLSGQKITLLEGGRGGLGNAHFKSSTNQSPRHFQPGEEGEERWIWLRLKLIADVGLVGLPNAGKSTFLSIITRAKPKIANYPFTTLHPNLGVAHHRDKEFIIADIPGLIENAHEGKGLGHRFLGHIERCKILIHLIDGTQENIQEAYEIIEKELSFYGNMLSNKARLIVLNKIDALQEEEIAEKKKILEEITNKPVYTLSSITRAGLTPLLDHLLITLAAEQES